MRWRDANLGMRSGFCRVLGEIEVTARSSFYLVGITTFQLAKRSNRVSSLKYQLLLLLPTLSSAARSNSSRELKARFYRLKAVSESRRDLAKACRLHGVSREWFYKWGRRLLRAKNINSLGSKSRRPRRSPNQTSERISRRIRRLRMLEPFSGPERISQDLKDYFNIECAPRTVNNVLKREGFISKKHSQRLTKKHLKRYRRPLPGYLQMDFKYTPYLVEAKQTYQLSAVDHHSSWRLIRSFETKDNLAVKAFIRELEDTCPFPIVELQTDNDTAFTDKFSSQRGLAPTGLHQLDEWCAKKGIVHRLIPPGEKELNGKVENTHKQDDREFFSQAQARTYTELKKFTVSYNERWNNRRKTKALKWRTPNQVLNDAFILVTAVFMIIQARRKPAPPKLLQVAPQALQTKNKTRRLTAASRYLDWLDWDSKSRKKA